MAELTAGLVDEEEEEETFTGEELDRLSANPPVRRESKKTKTQRNKEEKQKLLVRRYGWWVTWVQTTNMKGMCSPINLCRDILHLICTDLEVKFQGHCYYE